MTMEMGIMLFAALAVLWAVMDLVKSLGKSDTDKLKKRLAGDLKSREDLQKEKAAGLLKIDRHMAASAMEKVLAKIEIVGKVQKQLDQADIDLHATRLLGITSVVCLLVLAAMLYMNFHILICLGMAVIPMLVVLYAVGFMVRRRRNLFVDQMPDAFELMVQSLRAGHALTGAIHMVGEQMPDPMGKEMARVFAEQNLGKRLEDALLDLAVRIDAMDVKFFVSAVLIQRQTGGDLAEVLEKIAALIRERIELFGQVKSLTAEGRLSGWVLLALPPACLLYITVVNYHYMEPMFTTDGGKAMLLAAGIAMLLGMALIKKIVTIEV